MLKMFGRVRGGVYTLKILPAVSRREGDHILLPAVSQSHFTLANHMGGNGHAKEGGLGVDISIKGDPSGGALNVEGGDRGVVRHLDSV